MRKILLLSFIFGLAPFLAAEEKQEVTMTGSFVWNKKENKTHELKGVFTQTGENSWKVVWHFKWGKKEHVYTGTAKGNLKTGKLTGEAVNEGGKRSWTFEGEFDKDGLFKGTHQETTKRRAGPTGSFQLSQAE